MTVCSFLKEFTIFSFEPPLNFGVDDAITGFYRTLVSTWKPVAEMPFSHQQLPAAGIEGPSAPDLGKVGGSTAGWVTTGHTTWRNILCRDIHEKTSNWSWHRQSFFVIYCAWNQDGKVGSLSARANFCHPETWMDLSSGRLHPPMFFIQFRLALSGVKENEKRELIYCLKNFLT